MKTNILLIISLFIMTCLGCHKENSVQLIEVKYYNHTIESMLGPTWESVLNGEYPEYLEKMTISDKKVCDSIINQVKALVPMRKEAIPDDCKTDMQCIVHYYNSSKADTLLIGNWCISMNRVVMKDNILLVQMIRRHSGYYHPTAKSL
jgi:hypothetical protein